MWNAFLLLVKMQALFRIPVKAIRKVVSQQSEPRVFRAQLRLRIFYFLKESCIMKKCVAVVLAMILLLCLTACKNQQKESSGFPENISTIVSSETQSIPDDTISSDPQESNEIVPSTSTDPYNNKISHNMIYAGVYTVGKNLDAGSYLISGTGEGTFLEAIVFEDADAYNNYNKAEHFTVGQENDAIQQNAIVYQYIVGDETCYIGLREGNILKLDEEGYFEKLEDLNIVSESGATQFKENPASICTGVYFVGKDIVAASYNLTCVKTDVYMEFIIFNDPENYYNYHRASRFTNGEEEDAVQQNALQRAYIYEGDTSFVDLQEGNVLLIKHGSGIMETVSGENESQPDTSVDTYSRLIYPGVYFTGEDLSPNQYVFTCDESSWSAQVLIFETKEKYLDYHRADKITNGQESDAIEQSAISVFYISPGESCYLNLQDDMVLVIDNGIGTIDSVSVNWSCK